MVISATGREDPSRSARRVKALSGYLHPAYASSLADFGQAVPLPRCGGWLLRRQIDGSPYHDVMGPYPLFLCDDWTRLGDDLSLLGREFVSAVLVTDPFAACDLGLLRSNFDLVAPFKVHYVAELDRPRESFVRRSHRARSRRALRSVTVELCERPLDYLEDWQRLFANLVRRHSITGPRRFSRRSFEKQLGIPGLVMFRAMAAGEVVGLDLWYVIEDVAYGHLAAFSQLGYELGASYATKWTMLSYFSGMVRWVDLGGSAGGVADRDDGLAVFKRGWSTESRPVYLCGRILQPEAYEELTARLGATTSDYFPAYRSGEFG